MSLVLTGDHTHRSCLFGQSNRRNLAGEYRLVRRRRHFVLGGQIDPELHHFDGAATLRERTGMKFIVHDARGRRHPLHVSGADHAAATARIAVFHLTLVHDRDGLETAMGMLADAARFARRFEVGGCRMIEEQKRAEQGRVVVIAEQGTNREPVADPMGRGSASQADDFLHEILVSSLR
jgi:hypothetical protein